MRTDLDLDRTNLQSKNNASLPLGSTAELISIEPRSAGDCGSTSVSSSSAVPLHANPEIIPRPAPSAEPRVCFSKAEALEEGLRLRVIQGCW